MWKGIALLALSQSDSPHGEALTAILRQFKIFFKNNFSLFSFFTEKIVEVLVLVIGVVADSASATHSYGFLLQSYFALDSTISLLSQGFKFLDDQTKLLVHKTEYTLLENFSTLEPLNEGFPFFFLQLYIDS